MIIEKYVDNILIPAFIRKGEMKININLMMNNLENQIKRYLNGDRTITLLEHEMNIATLKHFQRVKQEEAKDND